MFDTLTVMLTSLITGLFALSGVTLGVLLEPVKIAFANHSKLRQDRAELCAKFISTATEMWSSLLAFNARYRMREVGGLEVGEDVIAGIEERYFTARDELRRLLLLLQLRGPNVLAEHATRVREADRTLRALRFELDDNGQYDRHISPTSSQWQHGNISELDSVGDLGSFKIRR